jgi:hypothetical protein
MAVSHAWCVVWCTTATIVKSATTPFATAVNADTTSPPSAINRHTIRFTHLAVPPHGQSPPLLSRSAGRRSLSAPVWPPKSICVIQPVSSSLSINTLFKPLSSSRSPRSKALRTEPTHTGVDRIRKEIGRMALALPNDVQKVANEGVVKLFGKWDAEG